METIDQKLQGFFAAYAERFNQALGDPPEIDASASVHAFADYVVGASPAGITGGKNDQEFQNQIAQGIQWYRKIGTRSMKILSLTITSLDEYHSLVKVQWEARYRKKDATETQIVFDVIYLVQVLSGKTKIFAYITGDEQKVLREHGLLDQ